MRRLRCIECGSREGRSMQCVLVVRLRRGGYIPCMWWMISLLSEKERHKRILIKECETAEHL